MMEVGPFVVINRFLLRHQQHSIKTSQECHRERFLRASVAGSHQQESQSVVANTTAEEAQHIEDSEE